MFNLQCTMCNVQLKIKSKSISRAELAKNAEVKIKSIYPQISQMTQIKNKTTVVAPLVGACDDEKYLKPDIFKHCLLKQGKQVNSNKDKSVTQRSQRFLCLGARAARLHLSTYNLRSKVI